jgi:hypothetical protein
MRNPQGTNGMPRSRYQTQARPEVQCTACSTSGHTAEVCKILPRVHSCMEYIAGQPTQASESLQQYRKTNHPMTKRQNKERLVNVLLGEIKHRQTEGDGWWEDVTDIVDTVAEHYHDEYFTTTMRTITPRFIKHTSTKMRLESSRHPVPWTQIWIDLPNRFNTLRYGNSTRKNAS